MLDDELLTAYINNFYGYGDYSARFWFVGIEEGGGKTIQENAERIAAWDRRSRPEIDDLVEYHYAIGYPRWFAGTPPIQDTWGRLIRTLLAAEGDTSPTTEDVRIYQRYRLGRIGDETALLELLPLPSPSTGQWMYAGKTNLPYLRDKPAYREHLGRVRAQHIADMVQQHHPEVVVFYSVDPWFKQWWELIAGAGFERRQVDKQPYFLANNGRTTFAIIKHPTSRPSLRNDYFHEVGRAVTTRVKLLKLKAVDSGPSNS